VFSIEPAAIDTKMLRDGLKNNADIEILNSYHPVGKIATPEELAKFAYLLYTSSSNFIHGSSFEFNGGIGNRLHDPF